MAMVTGNSNQACNDQELLDAFKVFDSDGNGEHSYTLNNIYPPFIRFD